MKKFVSSWSGGKDSCYACMLAIAQGMQPVALLNMMNENGQVSRSHAIPKPVLERQAAAMQLPLITSPASWSNYEAIFIQSLEQIIKQHGINTAVFGDIDLQAHRDWEEMVCSKTGIEAVLPLWQRNRKELVLEMIAHPIKAYIVSCNETMGEHFLGREINETLVSELEAIGVDACGENGEYHTLMVNCPLFTAEIPIRFGERMHHGNYWFIEME
ncbi:diphthine--ammonia ligase [Rhodocytophaga rosea]|uniref:Diphthine--ammonia ligase n=1 Tax=Rhodocytophaga rosea TaxID=2704465 RepID=A0A6C0GT45_9BACT|nr:diphthine--ammonia ligase [Rhodocytophaga rosea]QHT71067.1 diphthine--ammonia ligase [Rhodocytophaga rosea]